MRNRCCVAALATFFLIGDPTSPDDWWDLTIELNNRADEIGNRPDRNFLRQLKNSLSLSNDAIPTPAEQRWLISIKRELERRRK